MGLQHHQNYPLRSRWPLRVTTSVFITAQIKTKYGIVSSCRGARVCFTRHPDVGRVDETLFLR